MTHQILIVQSCSMEKLIVGQVIANIAVLQPHSFFLIILLPMQSLCNTCEDGYYLSSSSACSSCSFSCTRCTSFSYCTNCEDGYKLDDGECEVLKI